VIASETTRSSLAHPGFQSVLVDRCSAGRSGTESRKCYPPLELFSALEIAVAPGGIVGLRPDLQARIFLFGNVTRHILCQNQLLNGSDFQINEPGKGIREQFMIA
jgi:hypothetical protein